MDVLSHARGWDGISWAGLGMSWAGVSSAGVGDGEGVRHGQQGGRRGPAGQ